MLDLGQVGELVAACRREQGLTQAELARRARIGRSTLAALEAGRIGELGFGKVSMLLAVLGLTLRIVPANHGRPTFDELTEERLRRAEGLDR